MGPGWGPFSLIGPDSGLSLSTLLDTRCAFHPIKYRKKKIEKWDCSGEAQRSCFMK